MSRQTFGAVVVAASLAAGLGYGVGSAASPEPAGAASSNADVVRQLKKLDAHVAAQLRAVNDKLGASQSAQGSVRGLLTIICNYTASVDCG